jgi:hypothetical protein
LDTKQEGVDMVVLALITVLVVIAYALGLNALFLPKKILGDLWYKRKLGMIFVCEDLSLFGYFRHQWFRLRWKVACWALELRERRGY